MWSVQDGIAARRILAGAERAEASRGAASKAFFRPVNAFLKGVAPSRDVLF